MQLVEQYALAYPGDTLRRHQRGTPGAATAGDGKLRNVIAAVYGLSVAEQMTPLGASGEASRSAPEAVGERPIVSGYVSKPTCYKATRQYMSFFVNRRWVQSRTLSFAVEEAYHSLLLTGRHPVAVVNISLDPALIDVNVHPAKTEIKFLRERQVYAAVQRATRAAVLAGAETPVVSSRGFTVPNGRSGRRSLRQSTSQRDHPSARRNSGWQRALLSRPASRAGRQRDSRYALSRRRHRMRNDEVAVGGRALPVLRVLGQVSQSYIITEGPDGMYLVDQHAAHERILLERMIAALRARAVASQLLLDPLPVELAPGGAARVVERASGAAARHRLRDRAVRRRSLLVRAVPAALAKAQTGATARAAGRAGRSRRRGRQPRRDLGGARARQCRLSRAIKAGQTLASEEQRELIRQLEGAKARQSCCHGRPTMVRLSFAALEREFDRR